jgi:hypothetical protein
MIRHRARFSTPRIALLLGMCGVLLAGCSTQAPSTFAQSSVSTGSLSKNNYRILKSNLRGDSYGFNLLMILPIFHPNMADAKQQMYEALEKEGIKLEGRAIALTNTTEDRGGYYFLIGSVIRITLTADVIEFLDVPSADGQHAR